MLYITPVHVNIGVHTPCDQHILHIRLWYTCILIHMYINEWYEYTKNLCMDIGCL